MGTHRFALLALLFSFSVVAADIRVDGRTMTSSCQYFSTRTAELEVFYREKLPWGSSVDLSYGWGGTLHKGGGNTARLDWQEGGRLAMGAVGPYTWKGSVSGALNQRSSPRSYADFQFVFLVRLPDGTKYHDKGGSSKWGHYWINLFAPHNSDCVNPGDPLPAMRSQVVRTVHKN